MRSNAVVQRSRRATSRRGLVPAVLVGLALLVPSSSFAQLEIPEIHAPERPALDSRGGAIAPSAAQLAAVAELGAVARWNEFGTPQSLIKHGGFVATGIDAPDAVTAARRWVDENKALFRLSTTDGLSLSRDAKLATTDGHAVVFMQRFDGAVAAPDGVLTVAVTGSAEAGWKVAYVSSTVTGDESMQGEATLSAPEAWVESANAVGQDVSVVDVKPSVPRAGWLSLDVEGFDHPQLVRAAAFPTPKRGVLRAYETLVQQDAGGQAEGYRQVVDADTGEVLFREPAVYHAVDNPRWLVFPAYPHVGLGHFPWNYPSSDIRDLWCWFPETASDSPTNEGAGKLCQYFVANSASRVEWDKDARTGAPTFTTRGNNAHASENWNNSFFPEPGFQPVSPTRDYAYPWTNIWFENLCNQSNFAANGNDIAAATANLFAMHNRMHDWSYHLGFREDTWNAQNYNFGIRPEGERDELIGNVQAGGVTGGYPSYTGRDNANMFSRPDGQNSWTNMYLWQPLAGAFYAPCVDGDFDQSVIGHEYTHMIEVRMIGKGSFRAGFHAGAMGESHSDLASQEYLNEYNFVPVGSDHPRYTTDMFAVGPYVTSNTTRGIRNYNMAYASYGEFPLPGKYPYLAPLNFSDVGYDIVGPQVHADGEIWSHTNFDIRELLLQRYPSHGVSIQRECADGERPVYACPGNRRWIQLMFDSFLLMPPRPTFLDARDAQLAADVIRFDGANQDLLWLAFARRGFGQNAFTASSQDTEPIPDFESPLHEEATVVFNALAKDEGGHPVDARIYVGHYEARVSPIADTNPATAGQHLDNVARFVPDDGAHTNTRHRVYDFVAHAEGYGHVRFRLTELKPGETRTVTILFPTNWASKFKGATAAGDGTRHDDLIDDTEATNWEVRGEQAQGRQVLVQLAGAQRFERVKVSAMLRPGQNRFTALREFRVYACTADGDPRNRACDPTKAGPDTGPDPHESIPLGFKPVVVSQWDAFPGFTPRPVAPELILRTWEAPRTTATHVLFRVLDNQCTGQPYFQGEQDNDPLNHTDCRVGSPPSLPPRDKEVRAAELQLLSSRPIVIGAQVED